MTSSRAWHCNCCPHLQKVHHASAESISICSHAREAGRSHKIANQIVLWQVHNSQPHLCACQSKRKPGRKEIMRNQHITCQDEWTYDHPKPPSHLMEGCHTDRKVLLTTASTHAAFRGWLVMSTNRFPSGGRWKEGCCCSSQVKSQSATAKHYRHSSSTTDAHACRQCAQMCLGWSLNNQNRRPLNAEHQAPVQSSPCSSPAGGIFWCSGTLSSLSHVCKCSCSTAEQAARHKPDLGCSVGCTSSSWTASDGSGKEGLHTIVSWCSLLWSMLHLHNVAGSWQIKVQLQL